jgi:hypothetical protein
MQLGIRRAHPINRCGEREVAEGSGHAHAQVAMRLALGLEGHVHVAHRLDDPSRLIVRGSTGGGEPRRLRAPVEQRCAERLLERLHAARDAGLREVQPERRAADRAGLDYGDIGFEIRNVHAHSA